MGPRPDGERNDRVRPGAWQRSWYLRDRTCGDRVAISQRVSRHERVTIDLNEPGELVWLDAQLSEHVDPATTGNGSVPSCHSHQRPTPRPSPGSEGGR